MHKSGFLDVCGYFRILGWSDDQTFSQGGWVEVGMPLSSLTIFPRALNSLWEVFATFIFTLRCSKPKILGKNYRTGKKSPECSQKLFTGGTKGCWWLKFLSAECFDQSIWCLVDEKLHCEGAKGSRLPAPNLCRDTRSRVQEGTGTSSHFLQCILPIPGSPCTGTSWPRGRICACVL